MVLDIMYYIYHIPGEKIGTSVEPAERVAKQGYTKFDVLEVHSDIYEASDREIELQKEYGYKVDTIPYWQAVENRHKWTKDNRNPLWLDRNHQVNAGKGNKGIPKPHAGYNFHKSKKECPHCGIVTTAANIGRWHGDNCKLSPS